LAEAFFSTTTGSGPHFRKSNTMLQSSFVARRCRPAVLRPERRLFLVI
jgi:hypothetical protein